jgi:O-acetyl-ADP-ribose deacetylase (regulator of RNase III)/transcriptional regulator with XRE-family HTH domain
MDVDAIVNAANTRLQMGGGVCGAIFRAAGPAELQAACDALAPIETGGAAITPGFQLPAKYVIHAAGPVYDSRNKAQSEAYLRSAYTESLKLASAHRCSSIAFPLISSGIYHYPKAEALRVATAAITDYLNGDGHDLAVYLAVFDKAAFAASQALLGEVDSYIDEHYVDAHQKPRRDFLAVEKMALEDSYSCLLGSLQAPGLDERIKHLDEPFSDTLLRLIDAKGKTDVEVYKRANLDRKLFSKIRTGKGYTPKKATILALAVALELTLAETDDLLERAGYALSHASKFDVIVEFFIAKGNYNIYEINEVLFQYDQPLLGG